MVAARTWNKLKRHSVEGSETKQHNATNSTRPNEKKSVEMYLHTLMLRFGFRPTLSCRSPICLSLSLGSLYLCAAGLQRMLLLASSIDPISTARGYCLLHNKANQMCLLIYFGRLLISLFEEMKLTYKNTMEPNNAINSSIASKKHRLTP
jgi:hypothetical protein